MTRETSDRLPQERSRYASPGLRSFSLVALPGGREPKRQAAVKGVAW
jgi:hypothetical protein